MKSLRMAVCGSLRRLVHILESAAKSKRFQYSTVAGNSLIENVQSDITFRKKDHELIDKVPEFPSVTRNWASSDF